jgi:hypothetical protein
MADQLSAESKRDFQAYVDFAVTQGVIKEKLDASKFVVTLDK